MSYNKPTRPPRSSKAPKVETTGHLMKIISTLSISQDSTARDKEKKKLEDEYHDSDRKLARYVKSYQDDLTRTMQAFSKVSSNVSNAQERCKNVKTKLIQCKKLLHCKRDELKMLWLELVEHKRVLSLLQEIEGLMEVPDKVEGFLKAGMHLEATEAVVTSTLLLEGSLDGIEALKDLKRELFTKREVLHQTLMKELDKHLYISSTHHVLKNFNYRDSKRLKSEAASKVHVRQADLSSQFKELSKISASEPNLRAPIFRVDDDSNSDKSIRKSISPLVHCISLLNRIPETVDVLKEKCQQELLGIIRRTAQHISELPQNVNCNYEAMHSNQVKNKDDSQLLIELVELIFEQFRCVIQNHKILLEELHKKTAETTTDRYIYEIADIWSKIQAVLEIFFGEYVDIHNSASRQPMPSSFAKVPTAVDRNSFFMRKRFPKVRNCPLFKFDSSSHAINMKSYLQEQKEALRKKGELDIFDNETQVFVCPPATKNITVLFKPFTKFIIEITEELKLEYGAHCPLNTFLSDCVKFYLNEITNEVNADIENVSKSLENWKTISYSKKSNTSELTTYLLESALHVDKKVRILTEVMCSISHFNNHFLHIICNILESYRESCQSAYYNLIQPHSDDKRIISSSWARDKDISRLLMSLPNWTNLKEKDCLDFEESPEEVRLRNKKESEILITNLSGDTLISQQEILSESQHLHNLALLYESLDWLGSRIINFVNNLPKQETNPDTNSVAAADRGDVIPASDISNESLIKIAHDFISLADTCLLVLHLEVRVHCFYYLQPLAIQGCYATRLDNQEPDPEILKLNADLSKIDESFQLVLKPCNIKYIFEGIGELISTILINCTNKIKRINGNGIKKMVRNILSLQQTLTGITMVREVALDRARQYFDLMYHSPEEILNSIVENGPQFQEVEYSSAFQLLQRSQPGSDNSSLSNYLERLHQILNEVAVSV